MSIQSIIQGIPKSGSDIDRANYLFDQRTITKGQALKDHELPIIEVELKVHYAPSQVRKWLSLVKKKQKQTQAQNALTHLEIARMYTNDQGHIDDTLYARSDFHRYENGVWKILPETFFQKEVKGLLEYLENKYDGSFTSGQQSSICEFIRQEIAKSDNKLDSNQNLINLKNGTFCIERHQLLPHKPEDYLTTQLPFDYDAYEMCPTWIWFLRTSLVQEGPTVFGEWEHDQKLIDFVQEAIGYSLTANMTFHKMFWCIGEGSNGKGVLFHILDALGGSAATAFNLDMLNQSWNTYHLAELAGKRLIYCTEVRRDFDFSGDAMLKAVTGGDKIQVRRIREQPFEMQSIGKLWISLNDFPHVKDTSHGFWRRVSVIPFNRTFSENEADPDLKDKLMDELPGIFNWAMAGLKRLYKNGKFTESDQVVEYTAKYQKESNTIALFVEDECIVDMDDENVYTTITPLYQKYKGWCQNNGYRNYSRKNFKRELERLGHKESRESNARKIMWIREKGPLD